MNSSSKTTSTKVKSKNGIKYAFYQYLTMLTRWGGKFVYLVQWSMFNFGFHLIISWALYKSYTHVNRLKIEIGPQTVKGGLVGNDF